MKKKNGNNITQDILFYARKLPAIKQMEALDFIKWLWGGPKDTETFSSEELAKMEMLANKKGGAKFKNWQTARKYLEGLMS
jgi:hypothetical protein